MSPRVHKVFFKITQQQTQPALMGACDPAAVIPACVNPPGRAWPQRGCLCSRLPLCARSRQLHPCVEADSQIRRDARGCGADEARGAAGRQSDDTRRTVQQRQPRLRRAAGILPLRARAHTPELWRRPSLDDGRSSARGCWHAPLYPTDKHEHQAKQSLALHLRFRCLVKKIKAYNYVFFIIKNNLNFYYKRKAYHSMLQSFTFYASLLTNGSVLITFLNKTTKYWAKTLFQIHFAANLSAFIHLRRPCFNFEGSMCPCFRSSSQRCSAQTRELKMRETPQILRRGRKAPWETVF